MKRYILAAGLVGLALVAGGSLAARENAPQGGGQQGGRGGRQGGAAAVPAPVINAQGTVIETPPQGPPIPGGNMQGKAPDAPASSAMTMWVMRNTKRRGEWVTIPVGKVKLHTWISYPDGTERRPVVVVMNSYAGLWDDFPRGIADQLAQDGFIGVVPDFASGLGPNGGNSESFESVDLVVKATRNLGVQDALALARGTRDYAVKLPQANGRSATLGIRFGGNVSFQAAALMPELSAAVVYDGTDAPDAATTAKITAPVLFFGGELDDRAVALIPPAQAAMKQLGKSFEYHIWAGTTGEFVAFGVPGNNTNANWASWSIAIKFLKQHTAQS
jgi:carboxymethylenebutenolidase